MQFEPLDSESEHGQAVLSFSNSMFKLREFMTAVREAFVFNGLDELGRRLSSRGGGPLSNERHRWFEDGVDCEILKLYNKGWTKGKLKIKVTLEFCPDELESPLAEVRQTITENS